MRARRSWWLTLVIPLAAVAGVGCAQTYDEGVEVICSGPVQAGGELEGVLDPPAQAAIAGRWVSQHLDNPRARALWASLAPLSPAGKAERVLDAAAAAGVESCPFADLWSSPRSSIASR